MNVRKLALLIAALTVATFSAILARSLFAGASAPQAEAGVNAPVPPGAEVLVATKPLPAGAIIDRESVRYQPWPKDLVQDAYYLRGSVNPDSLIGTVVRYPMTAGQPVTQGALVKPGDRGFLAAALSPGMRAVTVKVSAETAVAGFVFPGDRIDLMLTSTVTGTDGQPLRTSETIVRNLRVLATDQRTSPQDEEGKPAAAAVSSTITLETTPKLAEKIAVAQTIGTLSLSLRPLADSNSELERAIAAGEVSVPENGDPKAEKRMMAELAARPSDADTTFVTGADVSRFQRRDMPSFMQPTPPTGAPVQAAPATPRVPSVRILRGSSTSIAEGVGNAGQAVAKSMNATAATGAM
ncbi:Flp pilus assembly protein CpaB [Sphingomonas sp. ID0503]|uniref:Flp pilus assembly protein CpaB n=1 Tax=Sphingomonas sp. ID0503 TaxID=3399691 RepID=UPI003AFB3FF0